MVWNEWWPHDPVPKSRVTDPYAVRPTPQQVYWWCACGMSRNQPWCDGSHKGTKFKPVMYVPQSKSKVLLCGCKFSGNRPLCDGSHLWVKARRNMAKATVGTFGFFFTMGVFTTWIFHP
ncbi:hypothetical protein MACJ_001571 [Theileria orientalis]|uniref:Iron-binding zinc finger CDGSH type domain-containing protein n=1 Tax=Theileria orientalis TaxID=68886 RepID=A0A976M8S9_THEOR|nr:hypothetical protein MACJ_001571 [Theileria orientalis]